MDWQYQKTAADDALRNLIGVKGVSNLVEVKPRVSKGDVRTAIDAALKRNAAVDASRIRIETEGDRVTLSGTVRSWIERDEAEHAAWAGPGVCVMRRIARGFVFLPLVRSLRYSHSVEPSTEAPNYGKSSCGCDG